MKQIIQEILHQIFVLIFIAGIMGEIAICLIPCSEAKQSLWSVEWYLFIKYYPIHLTLACSAIGAYLIPSPKL